MKNNYYQSSNDFSLAGLFLMFATMAVGGTVLAIPYLFLVRIIPMIILNIIVACIYGGVLGFIASKICQKFKIRNVTVVIFGIILGTLIFTYFKWIFFVSYVFDGNYFSLLGNLVFNPPLLWDSIRTINHEGTFTLGKSDVTRTAVTGVALWVVWIVEFAIIGGFPLFMAVSSAKKPFIESENDWAKSQDNPAIRFVDFDIKSELPMTVENPHLLAEKEICRKLSTKDNYIFAQIWVSSDYSENYVQLFYQKYDHKSKRWDNKKASKLFGIDNAVYNEIMERYNSTSAE
ncbi:MAG: hypothetical protein RR540_04680 [Oscillospiraceae bacterium]